MGTEAPRLRAKSIASALASLVAAVVIAGLSPASAGCPGVSTYQNTGAHAAHAMTGQHSGVSASSGSVGTSKISSCPSTASGAIMGTAPIGNGGPHIREAHASTFVVRHSTQANATRTHHWSSETDKAVKTPKS
jgi:hypothetical protein